MRFEEFLVQAKQPAFWQRYTTIFFQAETYPSLFLKNLFAFLLEKQVLSVTALHCEDANKLAGELQQCFLGQKNFYWTGALEVGSKKKKNEFDLVSFLTSYEGPHSLACFISKEIELPAQQKKNQNHCLIELPESVNYDGVRAIFECLEISLNAQKMEIIRAVMHDVQTVSLDLAVMMAQYVVVTPVRLLTNLRKHLTMLIEPEVSLQSLAQTFFTKKEKDFYRLWSKTHSDYAEPFWVAFWSEQLWKAYNIIKYTKQNDFASARRFTFRMYPAFVRQDWRGCSSAELIKAYSMLYEIDFGFKKGSEFCSFDVFFSSYFLGKFA